MKPRLRQMLNEIERAAEIKSVKIPPITMRPVMTLYQEDEPLVGEFLRSKKIGWNSALAEEVAEWLEAERRFEDAKTIWKRALAYWHSQLDQADSDRLLSLAKPHFEEKVEEALQALNRLHERSNAEAASP